MSQENQISLETRLNNLENELNKLRQEIRNDSPAFPEFIQLPDRCYSVAKTPITVAQYRNYCEETNESLPPQPQPKHENNPIVNVSWDAAINYCNWLSSKSKDTIFRLPTEDEFEHFCGDHQEGNSHIAVYEERQITKVATKEPNNYGLYDTLGLVWEWQQNPYDTTLTRVVRGGSWYGGPGYARSAVRYWFTPSYSDNFVGFRVLSTPN